MVYLRGLGSLFSAASLLPVLVTALTAAPDPCTKIGGKMFVPPADALACVKSFPFNKTLRQNVLTNVGRVFDFYTFENYYLSSPPPSQSSTVDIRKALAKINTTEYKVCGRIVQLHHAYTLCQQTDYDFNKDLYDFTNQLNDGHTRKSDFEYHCFTIYRVDHKVGSRPVIPLFKISYQPQSFPSRKMARRASTSPSILWNS
jgi:hypothetical protein